MSGIDHAGISLDLPSGWEAVATGGGFRLLPSGAREPTVIRCATFPLPADGDSFGADVVTSMTSTDVLVVLFEYEPEVAGAPPFTAAGVPNSLEPEQFSRESLQRAMHGQSGLQHFFTERGRAFCLYVVLGSHIDRASLLPKVNRVLDTLEIA